MAKKLPQKEYHQAQRIGEGSFGAVCTVYDDEGTMFAMKVFEADEDDETLAKETIREVSLLRLLRSRAKSFGILELVDVYENPTAEVCMVMQRLTCNLQDAIEGKLIKNKLKIAHGLLSAVAFLHENGIIHRDIKCDNIMFDNDKLESVVLIDFSLSKPIGNLTKPLGISHTGDVGTAKYIAPEVYRNQPYCLNADMWSCGVVLLEVFSGEILKADKDKAAFLLIEEMKAKLPQKKPISSLLKALLQPDPSERVSAIDALKMEPLYSKFSFPKLEKIVDLIPCPPPEEAETEGRVVEKNTKKQKKEKVKQRKKGKVSKQINPEIKNACNELEFENDNTLLAADEYWRATKKNKITVTPFDCALLASKLYEASTYDFSELEEEEIIEDFDLANYIDAELSIFKAMDYNLFICNE